ncbi:MAG TPA: hypothetical protein VM073_08090 [Usitatibacter sp.]|nr:hypothetical protein [Usitatibacter sp.]
MNARTLLAWSVRRELWEHRAVYIAPLAIAALVLVAFLFHAPRWAASVADIALDSAKHRAGAVIPFSMAASAILFTSWIVGVFYSLDALNAERRDRSILFWKSMPVSDRITVASKAAIPLVVLPLVALAIALATQLAMALGATVVLAAKGMAPSIPWTAVPWGPATVGMFYAMAVHVLWFAPLFAWLLLVSAWARRAPFLWTVLPVLAAMAAEKIAFDTTHFARLLKHRFVGGMNAFVPEAMNQPITQLSQLDPARFLSMPGLWLGLAFAFACLAIAVRVRRRREPS